VRCAAPYPASRPGAVGVIDTMRRSVPRVQKNTPPVELNSPSCQPASIHSSIFNKDALQIAPCGQWAGIEQGAVHVAHGVPARLVGRLQRVEDIAAGHRLRRSDRAVGRSLDRSVHTVGRNAANCMSCERSAGTLLRSIRVSQ
jgi:hypothetical protein